jgi:cytochrome c556
MRRMKTLLVAVALLSIAADTPDAVVKYRQTTMKSLGAHMAAMSMMVKKQVSDRGLAAAHAESVHAISRGLADLFPRAERVRSGARPEIWSKPKEFRAAADQLETESAKLSTLAARRDWSAFDTQFARVAAACDGCHKSFRVRDID